MFRTPGSRPFKKETTVRQPASVATSSFAQFYTGSLSTNTSYPIGSLLQVGAESSSVSVALNQSHSIFVSTGSNGPFVSLSNTVIVGCAVFTFNAALSGTWVCRGANLSVSSTIPVTPALFQRIA